VTSGKAGAICCAHPAAGTAHTHRIVIAIRPPISRSRSRIHLTPSFTNGTLPWNFGEGVEAPKRGRRMVDDDLLCDVFATAARVAALPEKNACPADGRTGDFF
jgi:hypothetical protein